MLVPNAFLLDSTRVTRLIQDQQTRYQQALPMRFLDRLAQVPADDDEIIASITAKNFAADLVPDDQAAPVYDALKLEFVTNVIPNIKWGTRLPQALLNRLNRIRLNLATTADSQYFERWEEQFARDALRNVRERANQLACAMMIDSLSYSRNGVIITGSWGMPSDLKSTPTNLWTSAANATPVTDLLTMKMYAANTYGEMYDRATMSTADLLNAFATAEFKAQVASLAQIASPLPAAAFNPRDPRNATFLSVLTGLEIEVDDKTFTVINADGTQTTTRDLPLGKVALSSRADDGNTSCWDFANGVVTESLVAALVGDPDNFPVGEQYGPVAFYTPGSPDLNPPGLRVWAVQRGFPRKHRKTASAVLTVQ
jgi:hypothetical protein